MWRDQDKPQAIQPALKLAFGEVAPATEAKLLRPEQELYFLMSLGSVYESSGKDEIAISCYMKAITEVKLEYNHPDQAFPYCGLGSVFYHIDEPAWALRCFLKAREIRELRLGGDTVDTATVYNNLGCNMYMLERNQESKAYFELASAIMDAELGPHHERTLTVSKKSSSLTNFLSTDKKKSPQGRQDLLGHQARVQTNLGDGHLPPVPARR